MHKILQNMTIPCAFFKQSRNPKAMGFITFISVKGLPWNGMRAWFNTFIMRLFPFEGTMLIFEIAGTWKWQKWWHGIISLNPVNTCQCWTLLFRPQLPTKCFHFHSPSRWFQCEVLSGATPTSTTCHYDVVSMLLLFKVSQYLDAFSNKLLSTGIEHKLIYCYLFLTWLKMCRLHPYVCRKMLPRSHDKWLGKQPDTTWVTTVQILTYL